MSPTNYGARPGDIVHVRSKTLYGRLIRRCLVGAWGNHDGTLIYLEVSRYGLAPGWYVAEALVSGFCLTPWADYLEECEAGARLAFLRPVGMAGDIALEVQYWALEMAGRKTPYNFGGILRVWWQIVTRANMGEGRQEWDWYCTQAVRQQHDWASRGRWDIWGKEMPTPLTTEKRILAGKLAIVTSQHPTHDLGALELTRHLGAVHAPA
jgi:hypothetical protein